ncbi:MAG TPA: anhydro-N-acetylmuramic acid kinase, partial [Candidatus Eremiobacteraceae bacterium]|nr:anhydro-N-acetylmuramic acid kinase [Candidatus Eremiobacteraceae bacterium]
SIISSDVIEGTRKSVVRDVCALNFAIGEAFAAAALAVAGDAICAIDLIGSHGQTIYHLPDDDGGPGFARSTLQIGEPAVIAERTGITCVADFRVADVAAGGLGAPLVSYVDHLLLRDAHENRAALNIGGIANLTVLPAGKGIDEINAFDIGPGNMLIDLAAAHFSGGRLRFDERGAIAGAADVSAPLLEWLGAHPYYARRPPKTTGRETFGDAYFRAVLNAARAFGADDAQTIATLTASAARQIAQAMPPSMQRVIVSGGGAFNDTMMAELRAQLAERYAAPPAVSLSGEFGLPPDAKEAMAFAVLAYQTIHGRPSSAPGATGATRARILGKIAPGENFAALMNELSAHRTVRGGAIDPKARV